MVGRWRADPAQPQERAKTALALFTVLTLVTACGSSSSRHRAASTTRSTAGPRVLRVEVTFKCEDEEQGHPIGPAIIFRRTSSGARATESPSWVTIPEAKRIARRLHARYTEDC
jgi:hypothetical protein